MKHFYSLLFLFLFVPTASWAQTFIADVEDFLTDMVLISNQYVSPAADAAVYQSTASWHSSAASLKKFEVDVSLHVNVLPIPDKQKSFTVANSDFISVTLQDGSQNAILPTALGDDTATFFDFTIEDEVYEFQSFEGINKSVLYYPYIQASVGLWQETEVSVQYVPKITIDDSGYQTFGGAIKHNISQYFRNKEKTAPFEFAAQVSYSRFTSEILFEELAIEASGPSDIPPLAVLNSLYVDADTWVFQAIGSKRLQQFELVGSMALANSKFDYTMGGRQSLVLDLLNEAFEALEDSEQLVKGTVGANYHFKSWYVSSLFTVGKFPNVNVSLHYKI